MTSPGTSSEIELNVNGRRHVLQVEHRSTLLDVLRNDLNLTGCKDIDNTTAAGADTVIIDGKAALASARLAIECQGKKIRTVESLADGDAYVAYNVAADAAHALVVTRKAARIVPLGQSAALEPIVTAAADGAQQLAVAEGELRP